MQIGIWGDSITYGACDSEGLGWPGRVRKSIDPVAWDHEVYNFGICGENTRGLLERFSIEARSIEAGMIVFAIGINDSKIPRDKQENSVPPAEFKQNIDALLDQAQVITDRIYVVGATSVDEELGSSPRSRFINVEIEKYNGVLKACAEAHGVEFIDVFAVIDPASDLADGLHPNAQGYQKLFEAIAPRISL